MPKSILDQHSDVVKLHQLRDRLSLYFLPKYPTPLGFRKMWFVASFKRRVDSLNRTDPALCAHFLNEFVHFLSDEIFNSKLSRERRDGVWGDDSRLVKIAKQVCDKRTLDVEVKAKRVFVNELRRKRCSSY